MRKFVVTLVILITIGVGILLLHNSESSTRSAHDWCLQKWAETAVVLQPTFHPTREEVERGQYTFLRQCMSNQGYNLDTYLYGKGTK